MRRWFLLIVTIAAIGGVAFFVTRGRADAHAVQVSSEPAANSQLADSPTTITIGFSEPVEPSVSSIQLYDQEAQQIPIGAARFFNDDPKKMAADVTTKLEPGIYTIIWRNLSTVDGHTWAGSLPFSVLGPNGEVPTGAVVRPSGGETPSNRPGALDSVSRWIVLLSTSVILGGTTYVLFVARPATRRLSAESGETVRYISRNVLLITSAIAAFFILEGSLLQLVVQADRLGGLGKADNLLWDTRLGHYLLARQGLVIVALLALALGFRARNRVQETVAVGLLLLSSVGVLLTQSLVSHSAGTSAGSFWTTAFDIAHLASAAIWIGMLVHVGLSMPRWLDELRGAPRTIFAAESFQRFSLIAAVSVGVLMTSGVLSALAQFTAWKDLWTYSYGWSLIAKMAALMPLLIVAALNAFFLRSRVEAAATHMAGAADDDGGEPVGQLQRLLSNTVRVEAVLGIIVLVAAAVLIQLEPPRAAAEAQNLAKSAPAIAPAQKDSIQKNAEASSVILALKITPGTVGQNTFELGLGSEFGSVGEVIDTRLDFENTTANTGQSSLPLPLTGSAKFAADGSNLSLPGDWTVTATVHRRNADDVQTTFQISVTDAAGNAPGAPAAVAPKDEGIWHWPFDGGRSVAAIIVLIAGGIATLGWLGLRVVRRQTAA